MINAIYGKKYISKYKDTINLLKFLCAYIYIYIYIQRHFNKLINLI